MKLLHYSATPFQFDSGRVYEGDRGFKPIGLWLSVEGDNDWRAWCEGEQFKLDALKFVSEVTLKPESNVLVIHTAAQLEAFNARFRREANNLIVHNIEWDKVKVLYDGLIIAPFQTELWLDFMWYYCWDCASAVIWNISAIGEVK